MSESVPEGPSPQPAPTRPRRTAWPLRPGLSAILILVLVGSLAFVVGLGRQRTVVGARLSEFAGLPARGGSLAPAGRTAVVLGIEPAEVVLAAPGDAVDDAGLTAPQRDALQRDPSRPASRWTITLDAEEAGWYAPTSGERAVRFAATDLRGGALASPERTGAAREAVADALADERARVRPWADLLRTAGPGIEGEHRAPRTLVRGWLLNGVTLAAIGALLASLSPRRNAVIDAWDQLIGYYDQVGPAALLAVLWGSAPAVLGILLLLNIGPISDLLQVNPVLGWFGYVAVFIVSAGIGFLPTYGQSILGGWVFGLWAGFPGAMLGFVGGSVIGYVIAQRVSAHKVEDLIAQNPKSRAVRDALIGHGFWRTLGIVTLIRIPPNSPFALTNLVMASSGVGFVPYVIGTALGMAPRTFIAAALAAAGRATGARDIQEFITEQPWWALPAGLAAMVICLGIVGLIAQRALKGIANTRV